MVILGFINDKTAKGKYRVKDGVHVMSGKRFLQYTVNTHLKQTLKQFVPSSQCRTTEVVRYTILSLDSSRLHLHGDDVVSTRRNST